MEGFSDFIEKSFTAAKKWRNVNFHDLDKLVVDSQDLFEWLYQSRHSWEFGGEHYNFYTTAREFFGELLSSGLNLIMVLHGPQPHEKEKLDLLRRWRTEANDRMWRSQRQRRWQPVGVKSACTIPPLAWSVFIQVVSKLELTYHITREAGMESRREISALADHHKCPVLGTSPDYYMFEINGGYIPLHTVSTIIASGLLYHAEDFCDLYSLKSSHLRLLVPAVYGNGVLEAAVAPKEDLTTFLKSVSKYENYEAYISAESREEVLQRVAKNFEASSKLYSSRDYQDCLKEPLLGSELPDFYHLKLKEGFLDAEFLNVIKHKLCVLSNVVENVSKESAWLASRSIRQYSYGLLIEKQEDRVKEVLRAKASPEVTEVMISPVYFTPPRNVGDFGGSKDIKELRKLILLVSGVNDSAPPDFLKVFEALDRYVKLPVCAAYYWYHNGDSIQKHLVKSLLLSILACFGMISFDDQRCTLDPLTADTKQDHFTSLHGFAQWQCVYHDLRNLNCLLREPFVATNPALLFSGKVTMYYASFVRKSRSPDEVIHRSSEAWVVYNDCLYLITGSDADKRKGGPPKGKSTPKPAPQPQQALGLSNRFDALALVDD